LAAEINRVLAHHVSAADGHDPNLVKPPRPDVAVAAGHHGLARV
jgi:hypothetical protein